MISKCINNLSPIFRSFVAPESLIFMAGCDIICLTARQKIRGLSGWHASKSTSLLLNERPSYNNWKYFLFLLCCFILFYLLIRTDGGWKGEKTSLCIESKQLHCLCSRCIAEQYEEAVNLPHSDSAPSTETASVTPPRQTVKCSRITLPAFWNAEILQEQQ